MLCCVKRVVQVSCTGCQSCIVHVEYLTTKDGFAPGWGFLGFLTRDFVPREWILTNIFRKMSNPHPLPDPPPRGITLIDALLHFYLIDILRKLF